MTQPAKPKPEAPAPVPKHLTASDAKDEWRDTAREAYRENEAKKKHQKAYEAARTKLKGLMDGENVASFPTTMKGEGDKMLNLKAEIGAGRASTVFNNAKLCEEIGLDAFLKIVDVNKTRAEEHFGKAVLGGCSRVVPGNSSLQIKKVK